jgi:ketosteroid isomerase-like protein
VEKLTREFAKCDALAFELKWGSVQVRGNIAWVATVMSVKDSRQDEATGRFTAVLERRNGQWFFVQMHFSFPAFFGMEKPFKERH